MGQTTSFGGCAVSKNVQNHSAGLPLGDTWEPLWELTPPQALVIPGGEQAGHRCLSPTLEASRNLWVSLVPQPPQHGVHTVSDSVTSSTWVPSGQNPHQMPVPWLQRRLGRQVSSISASVVEQTSSFTPSYRKWGRAYKDAEWPKEIYI